MQEKMKPMVLGKLAPIENPPTETQDAQLRRGTSQEAAKARIENKRNLDPLYHQIDTTELHLPDWILKG